MNNQGQSLLETVIALGIVITGLVAVLALIIMGISFSGKTPGRIIAVNLAREGIEILRAIRDSNQLDPNQKWPFGLKDGYWVVNYDTLELQKSAGVSSLDEIENCQECRLYLDGAERYIHDSIGTTSTIFKRLINIEEQSPHEKRIISKVLWQERNRTQSIILENILTDWR